MTGSFNFSLLHSKMVEKALLAVKVDKAAASHDRIPGILLVLIRLAAAIAPNLTMIFNSSLTDGIFPDTWKKGKYNGHLQE